MNTIKSSPPIVEITLGKRMKRSWKNVKDIFKKGLYNVDLRKASKTYIPLEIQCGCKYKTILEIRRVKDFPLEDVKCKCGVYMIKWLDK